MIKISSSSGARLKLVPVTNWQVAAEGLRLIPFVGRVDNPSSRIINPAYIARAADDKSSG